MLPVYVILLALASLWDVIRHRIPNALALGVMATGVIASSMNAGWSGLGWSALAVVVAGAITWPAWTRRWIGGGDLKLAAAAAAWLGVARLPVYLAASSVAIGLLSMLCWALSGRAARSEILTNLGLVTRGMPVVVPLHAQAGRARVPAGAGFSIGAVFTLAMTGGL